VQFGWANLASSKKKKHLRTHHDIITKNIDTIVTSSIFRISLPKYRVFEEEP